MRSRWSVYEGKLPGPRYLGGGRAPRRPALPAAGETEGTFGTAADKNCTGTTLQLRHFVFCFACGMRRWSVVRCLYNNTATQTRRRNLALALAQGGGCAHDRAKEARKGTGSWEGKGSGRKAVCMCGIIRRCSPPSLSALWPFQVITSGQYSCHGTSQGLPRHYTIPHTHHASLLPPLYSDDFKSDGLLGLWLCRSR